MRIFLAVSVGEQFAVELTTALAPWRPRLKVRWTRPQTWHMTLQFLGEWPENRITGLIRAIEETCAIPSFPVDPGPLDAFPHLDSPRVLFLQMKDDGSSARLAARVRETVEEIWPHGPQDRREFRSHLTLARIRRPLSEEDVNLLKNMELTDLPRIPVEGFKLYRSVLGPDGPRYSELAFFPLRKKGE